MLGCREKGCTHEEEVPEGCAIVAVIEEYFGAFFSLVDCDTDSSDCRAVR